MDAHGAANPWTAWPFVLGMASAVVGMLGTWLMSRRYAREFLRAVFYAVIWPFLFVFGLGGGIRDLLKNKVKTNSDIAESTVDMVLGMTLLFWAFFLQIAALVAERKSK